MGDGKAVFDDVNDGSYISQSLALNGSSKYKFNINISDGNGARIQLTDNAGVGLYDFYSIGNLSNGNYEVEFNTSSSSSGIRIYGYTLSGSSFSIKNISLLQVTDDTDLPRINYEGFSYQDALGSELITNGDFAVDGSWAKGTGWTISGGSLNALATTTATFQQNTGIVTNKTYKVTYTISNYVSGSVRIEIGRANVSVGAVRSANGTYTEYITALGDDEVYFDGLAAFTGSIDNVSVKEYLGQEVVPNSGCGSWLFEPQSTNLITYSEDFSNSYWTKSGASIVSNNAISPDGTLNASKLVEGTNNGNHLIYSAFVSGSAGNNYTTSFFVKANERTWCKILNYGGTQVFFDLENGVVGTETNASGKIEALSNDWYKISMTYVSQSSERAYLYIAEDDNDNSYQGDGTSGIYIWGAQVEQQAYTTSYIPTDGATSTRLQDLANNSGNSTLINSTEGVLYAEIAALANDGTFREISLNDGTTTNVVEIRYTNINNAFEFIVTNATTVQVASSFTLTDATQFNKIAFSYKTDDYKMYVNGVKVASPIPR